MGVNKEKNYPLYLEALELKLQGKSYDEIAKTQNVTKGTAWQRVKVGMTISKQDKTIDTDMIAEALWANTSAAIEIESRYLQETEAHGTLEDAKVDRVEKIKTSSQKIHAFIAGANSDDKGGEIKVTFQE